MDRPETHGRCAPDRYLTSIADDSARMADLLDAADGAERVPGCPDWSVDDLAVHLGMVQRWATAAAATGERPGAVDDPATDDPLGRSGWLRRGADVLVATLRDLDPLAPTWTPFPVEATVGVWLRRQAQEVSVHRHDMEAAVGAITPIAADLAADGLDEFLTLAIPRVVTRDGIELPDGSLHVHCTDVDGEWMVERAEHGLVVSREHGKADVALRGPAMALQLLLCGRVAGEEVERFGDPERGAGWLSVGL